MSKIAGSTLTLRVLGRSIFRVIGRLCRGRISSFREEAAVVISGLLDAGHLNIAEHALRRLHAAFPTLPFASNLCGVFDRIPPVGAAHSAFRDDPTKDVQIVARSSDIVVLLFCSSGHNLGLPLPMIHRWFARLPASLIYLRDFKRVYFFNGVQSLGPSREATLAELRRGSHQPVRRIQHPYQPRHEIRRLNVAISGRPFRHAGSLFGSRAATARLHRLREEQLG